jgi:hypothetical protein
VTGFIEDRKNAGADQWPRRFATRPENCGGRETNSRASLYRLISLWNLYNKPLHSIPKIYVDMDMVRRGSMSAAELDARPGYGRRFAADGTNFA